MNCGLRMNGEIARDVYASKNMTFTRQTLTHSPLLGEQTFCDVTPVI